MRRSVGRFGSPAVAERTDLGLRAPVRSLLPALGVLPDTWLGALIGAALYLATRRFAPAEEAELAARFGAEWDRSCRTVRPPWR